MSPQEAPVRSLAQNTGDIAIDTLDIPDRADCIRQHECRSPYSCREIGRCADTMNGDEDAMAFGYGSRAGCTGRRHTKKS